MDRAAWAISLCFVLVVSLLLRAHGNSEGDALNALKTNLADPNNVLQSWDPTLVNPCTWFHVTCNSDNSVTRVDLGNANLSGQLVPQLGQLPNLQYLELYSNNISGRVPNELGNLTNLVSLDLYLNVLSGPIPDTLGNLQRLRFLRLNNNTLSGPIPVILTTIESLQVLDLSNNRLTGDIPINGSFSLFTPISFQNNLLITPPAAPPPPVSQTPPSSPGMGPPRLLDLKTSPTPLCVYFFPTSCGFNVLYTKRVLSVVLSASARTLNLSTLRRAISRLLLFVYESI